MTSDELSESTPAPDNSGLEIVEVREGAFGVHGTGDTSGFGGLQRPVILPGASTPPYADAAHPWFDEVAHVFEAGFASGIEKVVVDRGEITFHVVASRVLEAVTHLRNSPELRFELCSSVSGVRYPGETGRELHVSYELTSLTHNSRIRVEASVPDANPHLPSVVSIYPTADWQEREVWDMFGVIFDGHPHLTRILMPDDWPGHPQRKDYPLGGIPVEFKGGTTPPPDERRSYS